MLRELFLSMTLADNSLLMQIGEGGKKFISIEQFGDPKIRELDNLGALREESDLFGESWPSARLKPREEQEVRRRIDEIARVMILGR